MSSPALRVDELGKASRRAAFISACGVFIVIASLFYSYYKLNALQRDTAQLEANKKQLTIDIGNLTKQRDALVAGIAGLQYSAVTPENQVFQIKASARHVPGRTSGGDPLYNFSAYVNAAPDMISKISRVTYDFNHPTFSQPHQEVTNPKNNFLIQYKGWGCLNDVVVTVFLKDGTSTKIDFDMCASLGPEWSDFSKD